jgi:hypothetical protein
VREEDCCGLLKSLDRRHDKTDTVKAKGLVSFSCPCAAGPPARSFTRSPTRQIETQPKTSASSFRPRKPSCSFMLIMILMKMKRRSKMTDIGCEANARGASVIHYDGRAAWTAVQYTHTFFILLTSFTVSSCHLEH